MGCDIHAHIEYAEYEREGTPIWWHYCTFFAGRDYWLFALMAGVRAYSGETPLVDPRGVPSGMTWETEGAFTLRVVEAETHHEGECSRKDAESWVRSGASKLLTEPDAKYPKVTHPDWHTPSWLSTEEVLAVLQKYGELHAGAVPRANMLAAVAAMKAFESAGLKARLVFWFDN